MKYAGYSDKGVYKKRNEDAYIIRIASRGQSLRGLLAICDGVSSSDDGRFASTFIVKHLNSLFEEWKLAHMDWNRAILDLHEKLLQCGKKHHKRYGTTLSLFCFEDDEYQFLQIGDSRIYLYHNAIKQLSVDQTLAQQKYGSHTISLEEYYQSCERHILTQCIGITKQLEIAQTCGHWSLQDAVLICSDGISNQLSDKVLAVHMKAFLKHGCDEAKRLAEEAIALGEQDNVSALLFTRGTPYG